MNKDSTGAPGRASRERQAAVIFSEIGLLASSVDRMGVLLVANGNDDDRDMEAFHTAIKALSSHIGLIADMGSDLCGGFTWKNSDPAKWLLPPGYHAAASGEQQ